MAEILFIARDKVRADAEANASCYKRGDAITIHPDGWAWSARELTNPDWRILRLTRITDPEDIAALLRPELGPDFSVRRRRSAFLDPAKLPAGVLAWLSDDSRAVPIFETNISRETVLTYIAAKEPRAQAFRVL